MFPIVYRGYGGIRKVTSERITDLRTSQNRLILDNHITPETQFTNVDFVPSFCKKLKDTLLYHNFNSLVSLANEWLSAHPGWQIINCETVTQYSHQMIAGVDYSAVVNILRVWIRRSDGEGSSKSPVFWFKDFAPERRGNTSFEPLDRVIDKINKAIVEGRVNGKIVQMETLKCPATEEWSFRPETTYVNDGRTTRDIEKYNNFVTVIRVFFLVGDLFDHEVVMADFVPFDLSSQTVTNRNCEKFSSMIQRAALWLRDNNELTLVNAQAVDIHVPDPDAETIETRITWKRKEKSDKEIRFLRIYCTKRNEISKLFLAYESISVSSLEFKLYLTAIAFHVKSFQQDINEWYQDLTRRNNDIKPRILNIETVVVPAFVNDQTGQSFQRAVDETLSCNQMEGRFKYSFVAVRVYYDECGLDSNDYQITRLP